MPRSEQHGKGGILTELDCKLASAFKSALSGQTDSPKNDKATKDLRAVCDRITDADYRATLARLFADFSRPLGERRVPSVDEAKDSVLRVRDRGFVEASSVLFSAWREVLSSLSMEQVLSVAPDAGCFEVWVKTSKVSPKGTASTLLANPSAAYVTAVGDWLLQRARPEELLPLVELFLNRQPRPEHLPIWSDALAVAMKKDKKCALLNVALRHLPFTEDNLAALAEAVRTDRSLLRATLDLLPAVLARTDAPHHVGGFVGEVFRMAVTTEGAEREIMTASLARLGTGILLADRRGTQSEAVLAVIQNLARQLRNQTRDETLLARTWVLANLSRETEPNDGQLQVTMEGARHLAVAFEMVAQGFAAKEILTAAVRNLGLTPIGKNGEAVSYRPLHHEDVDGGLWPGDAVVIQENGWAVRQETLIRAKVKRAK